MLYRVLKTQIILKVYGMNGYKLKSKFIMYFCIMSIVPTIAFSVSLDDYVNKSECSQIIDKQLYEICYSYEYKGATSGWVTLYGDRVNSVNIKKRPKFYNEKNIPMKYRTKYKDYTGYGTDWNRGHFIVSDADFDYDEKALSKTYTMANIIPQSFYDKTIYTYYII